MPLTRQQLNDILEILVPHVNTSPEGRQALIQHAFFGEPIVGQLTYTGEAVTFAMTCVLNLKDYNKEAAIVQLLETLRDHYVGENVKHEIDNLLIDINTIETIADTPSGDDNIPIVLESHVFISYSRKDIKFVNRLRTDLKAQGVPYWIDKEGLSPGTPNWERAIRTAIKESSAIFWVVSPASYESDYVSSELAVAEMYKRKMYPIWADGDNWVACVPLGKHSIQFVDMRGDNYVQGLRDLLAALDEGESEYIVPPDEVPDLPANTDPRNPYKGLHAFMEDDASDFFGREDLVQSLADRLQTQLMEKQTRFMAVLGPSGAGKSSVVMAGLLPALRQKKHIADSDTWRILPTITPGTHPMEELARAFADLMPSADATTVLTKLYTLGQDYLSIVFDMLPMPYVVLYIDQFEELFTLAKDDTERQAFISLLTGAATDSESKLIVLLSMRADFLDYPLNYPQLGTLFDKHSKLVQPMSIPELRDAIMKPAHLTDVSLSFDDGLVADIVFALRGQDKALAGALPLLQFTLERLFEAREGNLLTRTAYNEMGGVSGAIGSHSDAVFATLSDVAQDKLGDVFLPLVNIDEETGEPTRRRALLEPIVADPDAKQLVDVFVDNGLLQRGRDAGSRYLEVTHEALLRSWGKLVRWISITRDDLRLLRQIEREAQYDWDANGREYLLTVERLKPIHEALDRLEYQLSPIAEEFVYPQKMLLEELENFDTSEQRRLRIGDDLALLGDPREGVGVKNSLPDMLWLPVAGSGGKHKFEFGEFDVSDFFIAKYLTTFAQYQAFVDAEDGYQNKQWWQDFPEEHQPQQLNEQRTKSPNNPRDSISWYQSVAFGRWMTEQFKKLELNHPSGKILRVGENAQIRIPTEWEWQWVAMNGVEKRKYPWGDWQEGYADTSESGLGRAIAVGMYPHGKADCGALDMSGNLYEWCANNKDAPEIIDGSNRSSKVLRGGAFSSLQGNARSSYRDYYFPYFDRDYYGLRLVVAPMRL